MHFELRWQCAKAGSRRAHSHSQALSRHRAANWNGETCWMIFNKKAGKTYEHLIGGTLCHKKSKELQGLLFMA